MGAQDAQVGGLVGVVGPPGGAGLFEPGRQHRPVAALDHLNPRQELGRLQEVDALVSLEREQIVVAGHNHLGRRGDGAGDNGVIVGVSEDNQREMTAGRTTLASAAKPFTKSAG